MARSDNEPLGPFVQIDEALVDLEARFAATRGKVSPNKELVLVAAEANGRVRLVVHAARTMRSIIDDTQRTRWFTAKPGVATPEPNA